MYAGMLLRVLTLATNLLWIESCSKAILSTH